jgi:hypothetical protein
VSYFTLRIIIILMETIKALYISAHRLRPARPRQDFALNLSAKRCLCNTVGWRKGRIVEGCAAYRFAVTAARSRAATMTNFARSSLVLVLRAFFGGLKSCSLVNFFMVSPRWLATKFCPWNHGHLMAIKPSNQLGTPDPRNGYVMRRRRRLFCQPPPPARGELTYAPDPISEKKTTPTPPAPLRGGWRGYVPDPVH